MVHTNPTRSLALALAGALLVALPGGAAAWNAASHAYVARELHRAGGQLGEADLANRIYGANALDLFNAHFTTTWVTLQAMLHDPTGGASLAPFEAAETDAEVAFAFGFASHGNSWGADSTAHRSGVTVGRGEGYVIAKARALAPILAPALAAYGMVLPDETLLLVSHILVEQAVDYLLVARDPSLPQLLVDTALARDAGTPELLVRAFAGAFAPVVGDEDAAADLLRAAEGEFRFSTMSYGWALAQPDARTLIAGGIGAQAEEFLDLDDGTGAFLVPLIDWAISQAEQLCAPDFARELAATTGWVNGRLASHGVAP